MSNMVERALQAVADPGSRASGEGVHIGLLGRGIGASLTPVMHEAEGRRLGLAYRYDLLDFDRLGLPDSDLGAVLDAVEAYRFAGVNVTYPFKQTILPLLHELAPEAEAIGAVNTVVLRDGKRTGHNTDCWGFAMSFRQGLGDALRERVVQVGAGGAGAAVAHALLDLGTGTVDLVDADAGRAQGLARQLRDTRQAKVRVVPPGELSEAIRGASGLVNATPVGMEKYPGTPIDPALLEASQWVADIVYFPRETELIVRARGRGCRVLPGGGMAVYQALRAFALFTGREPDALEMSRTFSVHA